MIILNSILPAASWLAFSIGFAMALYAAYVAVVWSRYGHAAKPKNLEERDLLLDLIFPTFEVAERHHVQIAAPAEVAFSTASNMNLQKSAVVRAIFKGRDLILGGKPMETGHSLGLVAQAKEWGWGVLAENPGREIIFGGITQPWLASPVFRAVPVEEFKTFHQPGYAKIAWTLRADSIDATNSVFRTETRVTTTDAASRAKFRWYWALLSPGIILIRWISLGPLKAEAELRANQ